MNDLGAFFTRFHDPLETYRMVFRHGRAHDQDRIGIYQILLRGGCAASPERSAQTGHGGTVSYPGLIADADHAKPGSKQFFNQVILFVIQSRRSEEHMSELQSRPHL